MPKSTDGSISQMDKWGNKSIGRINRSVYTSYRLLYLPFKLFFFSSQRTMNKIHTDTPYTRAVHQSNRILYKIIWTLNVDLRTNRVVVFVVLLSIGLNWIGLDWIGSTLWLNFHWNHLQLLFRFRDDQIFKKSLHWDTFLIYHHLLLPGIE